MKNYLKNYCRMVVGLAFSCLIFNRTNFGEIVYNYIYDVFSYDVWFITDAIMIVLWSIVGAFYIVAVERLDRISKVKKIEKRFWTLMGLED